MLKEKLIEYRKNNLIAFNDKNLIQAVKDYPLYTELPIKEKAAAIILGFLPVCECGNKLKFLTKKKTGLYSTPYGGWREFCCRLCMQKSPKTIEKRRLSIVAKYGSNTWSQSQIAKDTPRELWSEEKKNIFKEKLMKTYQEKYGVDFFSQTPEYLEKRNATILKQTDGKFTNYFQDTEKLKKICKEKYGVEHYNQTEEGRRKLSENNGMKRHEISQKSRLNRMINQEIYDENLITIILNKDEESFKAYIHSKMKENNLIYRRELSNLLNISYSHLNSLMRDFSMENEYLTLGTGKSHKEKEVADYVISLGIKVKPSDRTILDGKEIDILCSDKKLGIEFDGLRYHSIMNGKERNYHLWKTETAESKGYTLLHIFENEWDDKKKRKIWKSIIKSKLGILQNKIYARKCILRNITPQEAKEFFDNNHLSGHVNASNYFGLEYDGNIVAAISFGKSRFSNDEIEIYRFACLLDHQVVGAFGKFFSILPKENLVSFADRRICGVQTVYDKFFKNKKKLSPCWWGFRVNENDLKHRMNFTKKKLQMLFENYDENKTAFDNMINNDYDIIYDCGNWKYTL